MNVSTRLRSTWLRPLVDGEEGYKYIGKTLALFLMQRRKYYLEFFSSHHHLDDGELYMYTVQRSLYFLGFVSTILKRDILFPSVVESHCVKLSLDGGHLGYFDFE